MERVLSERLESGEFNGDGATYLDAISDELGHDGGGEGEDGMKVVGIDKEETGGGLGKYQIRL